MKPLFGGSAIIAAALVSSSLILSEKPSVAETELPTSQQQKQEPTQATKQEVKDTAASQAAPADAPAGVSSGVVIEATDPAGTLTTSSDAARPVFPATNYLATAYSFNGRTASGKRTGKGLIAADPLVLPLGSRVRVEAGTYSGEYVVADTGSALRGKKIDIWTSSRHEANRFGRRLVKLTVLSYGPKRSLPRRRHKR